MLLKPVPRLSRLYRIMSSAAHAHNVKPAKSSASGMATVPSAMPASKAEWKSYARWLLRQQTELLAVDAASLPQSQ